MIEILQYKGDAYVDAIYNMLISWLYFGHVKYGMVYRKGEKSEFAYGWLW